MPQLARQSLAPLFRQARCPPVVGGGGSAFGILMIGSMTVMTLAHRSLGEPEPASLSASATMY